MSFLLLTFDRVEAHHASEEGETVDGVLSWQSQPKQKLEDKRTKTFIKHNHNIHNIYFFYEQIGMPIIPTLEN
ncbi:hypothetical protein ND894_19195 [Priestia megaterium]|uniref:hypothetical protein n=1 Tax=Priestia megaterium TaxID=1404 RepID=UPI00207680D8|nr:hypothetical protein [Priestia megaterium]USD14098.1 hypothetical protein ND894_19195 [Priestia megaterium]